MNTAVSADSAEGTTTDAHTDAGTGAEPSDAPTVGTILLAVEELWPESLAEEWDEVGLVAGHPSAEVTRILFAVDPTLEVIEEAIDFGAELLITPPSPAAQGRDVGRGEHRQGQGRPPPDRVRDRAC